MQKIGKLFLVALIAMLLCACLFACKDEGGSVTADKLQNEYGVTVEGDTFDGDTLLGFTVVTDADEIARVKNILAGETYNKEAGIRIFDISLTLNGEAVQPTKAVTITVPTAGLELNAATNYRVFHIKGDAAEALDVTVTADTIRFTTSSFSYFVLAEKSAEHTHECGSLTPAVPASFFEDGHIAYYHCEGCGKYFDENKQEVASVAIPKYSTDVVLLVNGRKAGDMTATVHENQYIEWDLSGVELKKGDAIAVADRADDTKTYDYHPNTSTNVTDEKKAHNDVASASVHIDCTPNGLYLSVSGFEYDGIVIRINGTEYPMSHVAYRNSNRQTYIYGYVSVAANDTVTVVDKDNALVYDFDDLESDTLWNVYDFHRGANGEVVFDYAARYGFEFDRGGDKKFSITKTFAPRNTASVSVQFDSERADVAMSDTVIQRGTEEYADTLWYIEHECVINKADVLSFISEHGLHVFTADLSLSANEKFNLKDLTNTATIKADRLVGLYGEDLADTFAIEGDYIKALTAVHVTVTYLPSCDSVAAYVSVPQADAYMMVGGNFEPMVSGAGNVATYASLTAAKNDYVAFTNGAYGMLAVTLDPASDATVWHRTEYSGTVLVYFDKAGTFDISLDLSTNVVSLTIVSLDTTPDVMTGGYIYFSKNGGNKTLTANPENSDELCYKNMEITDISGYAAIYDQSMNTVSPTLASGSEAYASIGGGILVYITQTGTFDFYIHKTTHVLRIVPAA